MLPRLSDLMTAPTDSLLVSRPRAERAIYQGRYADVLRGWEAQLGRFRRYLAEECGAARLPTAEGQALQELAASEFWTSLDTAQQTAIGEVRLTRSGSMPAGVIKKGHRFSRIADPTTRPVQNAAQFASTESIYVAAGDSVVSVPVEATTPGTIANFPRYLDSTTAKSTSIDGLFDPAFVVARISSAGGSPGIDDPWIRLIAAASYIGQFGPNNSALIAGAFEVPRLRHIAFTFDHAKALARLFVSDVSWASSDALSALVYQNLSAKWLGWGGRVAILPIYNYRVNVSATIVVNDVQALSNTSEIAEAVRTAIKAYFDDRPDFYTFKLRTLRGLIARADKRILTCTDAAVVNYATGLPLPEPPAELASSASIATHYMLIDDALNLNFEVPS